MAKYRLVFKKSVIKDLKSIPNAQVSKTLSRIERLANDPRSRGSIKLAGQEQRYRVRQGPYRILYEIEDDELIVIVVKAGHRKDVYQ